MGWVVFVGCTLADTTNMEARFKAFLSILGYPDNMAAQDDATRGRV